MTKLLIGSIMFYYFFMQLKTNNQINKTKSNKQCRNNRRLSADEVARKYPISNQFDVLLTNLNVYRLNYTHLPPAKQMCVRTQTYRQKHRCLQCGSN